MKAPARQEKKHWCSRDARICILPGLTMPQSSPMIVMALARFCCSAMEGAVIMIPLAIKHVRLAVRLDVAVMIIDLAIKHINMAPRMDDYGLLINQFIL